MKTLNFLINIIFGGVQMKKSIFFITITIVAVSILCACSNNKPTEETERTNRTEEILVTDPTTEKVSFADIRENAEYLNTCSESSETEGTGNWLLALSEDEVFLYHYGEIYDKNDKLFFDINKELGGYPEYLVGFCSNGTIGYLVFVQYYNLYLVTITKDEIKKMDIIGQNVAQYTDWKFERADRFKNFRNEAVLMDQRTIVYRDSKDVLWQVDIKENRVETTAINSMGTKFLFKDIHGIAWIEKDALETKPLAEILLSGEITSPVRYLCTRDGTYQRYRINYDV